jgi:hypothetical protein
MGIRQAIATAAVRQNHLGLTLMRFAPFFLVPFFRMLPFRQQQRWKDKYDDKY